VKTKPILIAAALALAGTAGAASAQYANNYRPVANNGFWQGAPDGLQQRIDWLQQRIQRGRADGSLDRQEARRAQLQLDALRRDADVLQQRLDDLSRNIRWSRNNGGYGYNGYGRDPYATDYDASRYSRDDPRYQERRLTAQDEVYRGSDGRYYCKRSDGTTGLIVGGAGGALLGNLIDGGRSRTAGTLIGGALGALLGRSVDQNTDVRCR
jgi:opacity protein-like surface antigen